MDKIVTLHRYLKLWKAKTETFPKKGKILCKKRNIYWVLYPTVLQVFVMDSADIRLHDPITHWIICWRETFLAPPPKKLYCANNLGPVVIGLAKLLSHTPVWHSFEDNKRGEFLAGQSHPKKNRAPC